jgi:hypothetical protein
MIVIRGEPLQLENKEARNSSNIVAEEQRQNSLPKNTV